MYKRFCLQFAVLAFCGFLVAGTVNYFINPYDVWGSKKTAGINMGYPKLMDIERWATPMRFTLLQEQPEVVFLGNSQVRWGIDPACYEQESGEKVYNFGIPGITRYEQMECVKHILSVDKKLKELVLCLDFTMYVEGEHFREDKFLSGFKEAQMGESRPTLENMAMTMLSWEAFKDSAKTVRLNHIWRWQQPFESQLGSLSDEAILTHFGRDFRAFDNPVNRMRREGKTTRGKLDEGSLERLQEIASLCQERGIKLTLVILPMHVRQLSVYADCWEVYEDWVRRVTQVAPVWNFIGYNEITDSDFVPGPVGKGTNEFFWDTVHPRHELGNIVQRIMLGREKRWQSLGFLLDAGNVEDYLTGLRADKEIWDKAHPRELEAADYSKGFVAREPQSLAKTQWQPAGDGITFDLALTGPRIRVKQGKDLDLWGSQNLQADYKALVFALLENEAGERYYALSEYPVLKQDDPLAVGLTPGEVQGFHLQMPTWDVPAGRYRLSFIVLSEAGAAYASEPQAEVLVK